MKYYKIIDDSSIDYAFLGLEPGSWLNKVVVGADGPRGGLLTIKQPGDGGTYTADVSCFMEVDPPTLTLAQWYRLHTLENEIFRCGVDGGEFTSAAIGALHEAERHFGVYDADLEGPRWRDFPERFAPGPEYVELNLCNYTSDDVALLQEWALHALAALECSAEVIKDSLTELASLETFFRSRREFEAADRIRTEFRRLYGVSRLLEVE